MRWVTPFRISIWRDVRAMLYAGFLTSGYQTLGNCLAISKPLPFWAGLSAVWPVPVNDALSTHSLALPIATCWGRRCLRLAAYPLLVLAPPARGCRPRTVGRCCLSSTGRAGVAPAWIFSCQSSRYLCLLPSRLRRNFRRTVRTFHTDQTSVPIPPSPSHRPAGAPSPGRLD